MNRNKHLAAIFGHFALRAPDDGGGGGGGGGGTPPAGGGDELEDKILRMVNAAVTSQVGRKLDTAITAAVAPLLEKLESLSSGGGNNDKGKKKDDSDPEIAELRNQIAALTAQNAEKDQMSAKAAKEAQEATLMAQIREGLTTAKVRPELIEGAAAILRGKMKIGEDGTATYRKDNKGWHEDLPPEEGIKTWLDTDQGKAHLAPVETGGSGQRGGVRTAATLNPATLPTDPAERAKAIKRHKVQKAKESLRNHTKELLSGGRVALTTGGPDSSKG